jgi:hypothetical protein
MSSACIPQQRTLEYGAVLQLGVGRSYNPIIDFLRRSLNVALVAGFARLLF